MPNPIASVGGIEIRGILAPRDAPCGQRGPNQISSRLQQWADQHEVVGERSRAPHSRQTRWAGPPHQMVQKSFDIVVRRVCQGDIPCSRRVRGLDQELHPFRSHRRFVRSSRFRMPRPPAKPQLPGQIFSPLLVPVGFGRAQLMVEMCDDEKPCGRARSSGGRLAAQGRQRRDECDAVGSAAASDHDAKTTPAIDRPLVGHLPQELVPGGCGSGGTAWLTRRTSAAQVPPWLVFANC